MGNFEGPRSETVGRDDTDIYKKANLPKKLAEAIVYRLTPEILAERINERPDAARASLALDLHVCDTEIN